MRRQAQYADGDDTVPYDRELIRSGETSQRRDRRKQASFKPPPRGRVPRARRQRSMGRTLRMILLLALLVVVVGGVLLFLRAATFNAAVSSAAFPSTALLGDLNGSERVNVLMVGYGGGDHKGAYLADSIQILSIDPATDTTTTVPIPRDLWIEGVESFSQNGKVNEVYAAGYKSVDADEAGRLDSAGSLMTEVLSQVMGLKIDHWLAIDFDGFKEMVDAVGGVTVDNPVSFAYTNTEALHQAQRWESGSFPVGEMHLDGEQALAYARARFTNVASESTDFARSVRQARIFSALRKEMGSGGIGSLGPGLGLMDAMEGRVRTDLSAIDLFLLSSHLSSDRRVELSEDVVLTATTNTIGQYILLPVGWTGPGDYGRLQSYLEAELASPIESEGTDAP
ncbi:MAG: LCP family protein [Chloroflexota bacterium]|nr:LCP family protein [Chloroflexota bacterium]